MVEFKLAEYYMIDSLKNIWKECFHDSMEFIDYFFDTMFEPKSTVVCTLNNDPIAMVYMLDNFIIESGNKIPSCYLYAVGTLPKFQKRGYMKKLISYAEKVAIKNKKKYITLFPAERNLCSFYERLGYKDFFKTKIVSLSKQEMCKLSNGCHVTSDNLSIDSIFDIRCKAFNRDGNIYWDKKVFKYAYETNNIYNGITLSYGESYAICRRVNDEVQIIESVLKSEDLCNMLSLIYKKYDADIYTFRMMDTQELLGGNFKIVPFGMLKSLDRLARLPRFNNTSFIGIVLD